jgi:predicted kinase
VTVYAEAVPNPPELFLITGIMAAGKSTVAQALAERLPKSVHLRGDVFRRMIVRGRAEMTATLLPEALQQLRLRYQLAANAARGYLEAGFSVVVQDVIVGESLPQVIDTLPAAPLYVVVLCPNAETAAARDAARSKTGYSETFTAAILDRVLRSETPRTGLWLDSSVLSVEATVDAILAGLETARVR